MTSVRTRWIGPVALAAIGLNAGCFNGPAVLTQLMEARRLASHLHVEFTKAVDAAARAVMSETDEGSASAAREAEASTQAAQQDVDSLRPVLQSLGFADEERILQNFATLFTELRTLDAEILPLAVENTNLKAQRLSFGAGREAVESVRIALVEATKAASVASSCCARALALEATDALLEIQVIQARHIAEADADAMSRMEAEMTARLAAARRATDALKKSLPPAASPRLAEATAALERFEAVNTEIVALSRRNTNVRSLALTLGRKRLVAAQGDDQLQALDEALSRHEFRATR